MKKLLNQSSISRRLFINVFIIIMIFCILILLANTLLIGPLYRLFTVQSLNESMNEILEIDFSQRERLWLRKINEIERKNTFEIAVFKEGEFFYASSFQPRTIDQDRITKKPDMPFGIEERKTYTLKQLKENFDKKSRRNVEYAIGMQGPYTFIVSQFLQPVNNTIRQSNILVLLITLVSIVIAGFYTNKLSRSFTKPIREIKDNVAKLMDLDFSEKCEVKTADELETLADDINSLSFKLESTLSELNVKNQRLEDDIESQRKFISNASHELRTPLSLIQGYADEIKNGYVTSEKQNSAYIEIILTETNKMSRLLKDMLELSRIQSGRMQFVMRKMSVKDKICTFVDKYDGYIMDEDLNVSYDFDDANDIGFFDSVRFEQVLANYISNAAKYGDEKKIIKISTRIKEDTIRIYVYNSGKHLDEKTLKQLWGRFYKGDSANEHNENSYGLGLSIVLAIQNTLRQECGANNESGGLSFWFDVERKMDTI